MLIIGWWSSKRVLVGSLVGYISIFLWHFWLRRRSVSDLVNRGTSTARGTRKPVQLVVYKRGSKARERKEKNSSAARYFIWSLSHVTRVYYNPRLPRSTVFHQRRNITPPSEKACPQALYVHIISIGYSYLHT